MKIVVLDRHSSPVRNVKVFVSWSSGGHSERWTNDSGIADLDCSPGLANYIQVDGVKVTGSRQLQNGDNEVSLNK